MKNKLKGKFTFFIILILILFLFITSIFGIDYIYGDSRTIYLKSASDIRWGIDIRGGVDATFVPNSLDIKPTREQMLAAEEVIKQRLLGLNITDSEVYTDVDKARIIVRFPWKENETSFDPKAAINEIGQTAKLTFREGNSTDNNGNPTGVTETVVLEGKDIKSARPSVYNGTQYVVSLEMTDEGKQKFADITQKLASSKGVLSIWLDNTMISAPTVNSAITDGKAIIEGNFNAESATKLSNQINSGYLPFSLKTDTFNTISPTLGVNAKNAMLIAGIIAYVAIFIFIVSIYRLPGFIAAISLLGQIGISIAAISGYFAPFNSFTLNLPGIAGIILAIGFGVDANIIMSERIKEEIRSGKSIDGSIKNGFNRGFSAIIDGNMTIIIVAIILMAAFGPPNSLFAKFLSPLFFMFGTSSSGAIYSFGYTLLIGVIANFIMGIFASRIMLRSISKFKYFRKPWLYGGMKNNEL